MDKLLLYFPSYLDKVSMAYLIKVKKKKNIYSFNLKYAENEYEISELTSF